MMIFKSSYYKDLNSMQSTMMVTYLMILVIGILIKNCKLKGFTTGKRN